MKIKVLILGLLLNTSSYSNVSVDQEINRVNKVIESKQLNLKRISTNSFLDWTKETFLFLDKLERREMGLDEILNLGIFPENLSLSIVENKGQVSLSLVDKEDNYPWYSNYYQILRGNHFSFVYSEDFARQFCFNPDGERNLCVENYEGSSPSMDSVTSFPQNVDVKISEIKVEGTCLVGGTYCVHDALKIELLLTKKNINDIANYFSKGLGFSAVKSRLEKSLGGDERKWINVKDVFSGWFKEKINTFPNGNDNEVCHGPARQFYNETLHNGAYDRSTEATAVLIKDNYCHVPNQSEPAFGDYMYAPGKHSGRFILKDPKSQRWISFSVYSGGISAYRFWWSDEDFSGRPFDRTADLDFLENRVDIWRRCK